MSARHTSPQRDVVVGNRRSAALYGLVIGLALCGCWLLAQSCGCSWRQTVAITLAGFLVASITVGTALR